MALRGDPTVRLAHCIFTANRTDVNVNEGIGGDGGAIAGNSNSNVEQTALTLHDCVFNGNRAQGSGSSDSGRAGAQFPIKGVNVETVNCLFFDDVADTTGGAIYAFGDREA